MGWIPLPPVSQCDMMVMLYVTYNGGGIDLPLKFHPAQRFAVFFLDHEDPCGYDCNSDDPATDFQRSCLMHARAP